MLKFFTIILLKAFPAKLISWLGCSFQNVRWQLTVHVHNNVEIYYKIFRLYCVCNKNQFGFHNSCWLLYIFYIGSYEALSVNGQNFWELFFSHKLFTQKCLFWEKLQSFIKRPSHQGMPSELPKVCLKFRPWIFKPSTIFII